ncbi:LysM peptidoglycan-binding domain-containing protein [Lacticaseibacillus daqingensis]|uniref:LysM peptidoglycan-binding domain-containing protein n=1 Tax=Lacticaseibacillus daqingensis TaxID=2486014 RepID=UPI000F7B4EB9|nr:LysM domain-containing protein [Lacticaseibacillus daqingensis]
MHKNDQEETTSNDPTKPWEKQFEDERDDDGNLSRLATRKKHHGTTVLTYVLWTLIALFVLVPVSLYAISSNSGKSGNDSTHIAVESEKSSSSKTKQSSSKSSSKSSSSQSSETSSTSESTASSTESSASQVSETSSSEPAATSSSTSSAETGAQYYTVKAGDNAYRIALNNGISLSQFYAWNGQSLHPGRSVRVK